MTEIILMIFSNGDQKIQLVQARLREFTQKHRTMLDNTHKTSASADVSEHNQMTECQLKVGHFVLTVPDERRIIH